MSGYEASNHDTWHYTQKSEDELSHSESGDEVMAFSNDDRTWLEGKFNKLDSKLDDQTEKLHGRITDAKEELTAMIVQTKDHARELVEKHEDKKHNPAKTLAILSSIAGLGAAAIKGIEWLFRRQP